MSITSGITITSRTYHRHLQRLQLLEPKHTVQQSAAITRYGFSRLASQHLGPPTPDSRVLP